MDYSPLITVLVSVVTSGLTAFALISHRMGRYAEKIDQLERCNLNTRLSTLEGRQLTRRNSPVDLTEYGTTVLNKSGGKIFVDENYSELKEKVEEGNPQTSYDIQEAARKVIEGLQEDQRLNMVKEFLFKEGMEWKDIVEVLGVYLRNLILDEKHIAREDIDKHSK